MKNFNIKNKDNKISQGRGNRVPTRTHLTSSHLFFQSEGGAARLFILFGLPPAGGGSARRAAPHHSQRPGESPLCHEGLQGAGLVR